jgi:uncharacterized UBP type Zn finger protein
MSCKEMSLEENQNTFNSYIVNPIENLSGQLKKMSSTATRNTTRLLKIENIGSIESGLQEGV